MKRTYTLELPIVAVAEKSLAAWKVKEEEAS